MQTYTRFFTYIPEIKSISSHIFRLSYYNRLFTRIFNILKTILLYLIKFLRIISYVRKINKLRINLIKKVTFLKHFGRSSFIVHFKKTASNSERFLKGLRCSTVTMETRIQKGFHVEKKKKYCTLRPLPKIDLLFSTNFFTLLSMDQLKYKFNFSIATNTAMLNV